MTTRTEQLERLVEELREAQLALEVAQLQARGGDADALAELADAEQRLERLRTEHARASGWLQEGAE